VGRITLGHLKRNNETYVNHLLFAGKAGLSLIWRGVLLLFHALLPIYKIPKRWNLESTSMRVQQWNEHTIKRKNK
jgi:hypothetical protein